jgi:predicted acylesterase/phospholipase RssA
MKPYFSLIYLVLVLSTIIIYPLQAQESNPEERKNAVLVISGGGARGAWGAGLSKAIEQEFHFDFRYIVGTSTGALMAPFIAIKDFETLKAVYTNTSNNNILRHRIFNKKGKFTTRSFLAAIVNSKSITSSEPLRKLLHKKINEEKWSEIGASGVDFEVSTIALELGTVRYRSSRNHKRKEMIDWIWASANQPSFMTPLLAEDTFLVYSANEHIPIAPKLQKKCGTELISSKNIGNGVYEHKIKSKLNWVDGGVMENIPIMRALEVADSFEYEDVVVIVNNKVPHQLYQTPDIGKDPFVSKDKIDRGIEYDSIAASILGSALQKDSYTQYSPIREAIDQKNKVLKEASNDRRLSEKIELSMGDIALLLSTPLKPGSFETDVFKTSGKFKTNGVINKLLATIDVFSKETFMNDIANAIQSRKADGKTFHIFFMPLDMYALNPQSLSFNKKNMKTLFENGEAFELSTANNKRHAEYFKIKISATNFEKLQHVISGLEKAIDSQDKARIIEALKAYDNVLDGL